MRAAGLARQSSTLLPVLSLVHSLLTFILSLTAETKQQPPSPPSNASIFSSLDLLFHGLRAAANSPGKCSFHGRSPISDDLLHVDDDCAVDVVNEAVYKLIHELKERVLEDTHWRFTYGLFPRECLKMIAQSFLKIHIFQISWAAKL